MKNLFKITVVFLFLLLLSAGCSLLKAPTAPEDDKININLVPSDTTGTKSDKTASLEVVTYTVDMIEVTGATVYIDGDSVGRSKHEGRIEVGTHSIGVKMAGYMYVNRLVPVTDTSNVYIEIIMVPISSPDNPKGSLGFYIQNGINPSVAITTDDGDTLEIFNDVQGHRIVAPGFYKIIISQEGYKTITVRTGVAKDQFVVENIYLEIDDPGDVTLTATFNIKRDTIYVGDYVETQWASNAFRTYIHPLFGEVASNGHDFKIVNQPGEYIFAATFIRNLQQVILRDTLLVINKPVDPTIPLRINYFRVLNDSAYVNEEVLVEWSSNASDIWITQIGTADSCGFDHISYASTGEYVIQGRFKKGSQDTTIEHTLVVVDYPEPEYVNFYIGSDKPGFAYIREITKTISDSFRIGESAIEYQANKDSLYWTSFEADNIDWYAPSQLILADHDKVIQPDWRRLPDKPDTVQVAVHDTVFVLDQFYREKITNCPQDAWVWNLSTNNSWSRQFTTLFDGKIYIWGESIMDDYQLDESVKISLRINNVVVAERILSDYGGGNRTGLLITTDTIVPEGATAEVLVESLSQRSETDSWHASFLIVQNFDPELDELP